ncbi:MAG: TlpA disulfide reductase family protein [Marinifilaceae bacterium]
MKKFLIIIIISLISIISMAQKTINKQIIKELTGKEVKVSDIIKHNAPVIVSIWASWCETSVKELDAINKQIKDWKNETNVKFIAVSVDEDKGNTKLEDFIKTKAWDFDIYRDENQNFKHSMNVKVLPHIFIIENGKIVWENSAYTTGDLEKIHEHIKLLTFGENVH